MGYKELSVKEGDTIASIAYEHGLFPETIWNDSKNSKLKKEREDPNVLKPGDVVYVREKGKKQESCATESKHRFRRKGVPAKLDVQLLEDDIPRANLPYELVVDGKSKQGETDSNGRVKEQISPGAKKAVIRLPEGEEIELDLGFLDPSTEVAGVKARLNNLGYSCGEEDNNANEKTKAALQSFQRKNALKDDGELNDETIKKLQEEYDGKS